MAEEIDLEKCNFRNFSSSVTLILVLDRGQSHADVHNQSRSTTHQIRSKSEKKLCGETCVWVDRPEFQFVRSSLGNDLIINKSSAVAEMGDHGPQ